MSADKGGRAKTGFGVNQEPEEFVFDFFGVYPLSSAVTA